MNSSPKKVFQHSSHSSLRAERNNLLENQASQAMLEIASSGYALLAMTGNYFEAQIITYLRLSGVRLGFLINFNVKRLKEGIKRFVV